MFVCNNLWTYRRFMMICIAIMYIGILNAIPDCITSIRQHTGAFGSSAGTEDTKLWHCFSSITNSSRDKWPDLEVWQQQPSSKEPKRKSQKESPFGVWTVWTPKKSSPRGSKRLIRIVETEELPGVMFNDGMLRRYSKCKKKHAAAVPHGFELRRLTLRKPWNFRVAKSRRKWINLGPSTSLNQCGSCGPQDVQTWWTTAPVPEF